MSKEDLEITARCPICGSGNVICNPEPNPANVFEFVCLDCDGSFTCASGSEAPVCGCVDKEAEMLHRFEAELHYSVTKNDDDELVLHHYEGWAMIINKEYKSYKVCYEIDNALYIGLDEHLLLHELFKLWGWI